MDAPNEPPHAATSPFRVGAWNVDPGAHALARDDGREVRVEPKVMALLVVLAERAGETVSREDLLTLVWPEAVVSEDALSRAVSKLRLALGDGVQAPRYVETIPKAGYRFVAPVGPVEPGPAPHASIPGAMQRRALRFAGLAVGMGLLVVAISLALTMRSDDEPFRTVRTVTHLPGLEMHPALTADGRRLAFVAMPREGATASDLYVQGLTDPTPRRLTDTPEAERHPVWLPDERLAFLRCSGFHCGLFETPGLGGGTRLLAGGEVGPWGLSATPDGRRLVAAARPGTEAPYRLVAIDLASGARTALTDPPAGSVGDLHPAVSPDGLRLAFVRHGPDGEEQVLVQALHGDVAPRALTHDGVPVAGLAWTPGGDAVVYAETRDGADGLWRVAADGGAAERLPLGAVGRPRSPALAAGRLVFESYTTEINLYTADGETDGETAELAPAVLSTGADEQPHLHPDGDRLVFVSDRSGASEIWTARLDGEGLVRLTDFGGARLGAPRWSPDGRWIVFEGQAGGSGSLYRVAAEGGAVETLTDEGGYDFGPRWSPDGRFVYFGSNREGAPAIWRIAAEGGPLHRVTEAGGLVGEPTADGEHLVFMRTDQPGLWMQPLGGGEAVRLDATLAPTDWGNWAAVDGGVVLLERAEAGARLVRIDLGSGRRTEWMDGLQEVPSRVPALGVTPDGRRLVLARRDRVESALVLVEPVE